MFSDGLGKLANVVRFDCAYCTVADKFLEELDFFIGKTLLMYPPPMMPFEAKVQVELFTFWHYCKGVMVLLCKATMMLMFTSGIKIIILRCSAPSLLEIQIWDRNIGFAMLCEFLVSQTVVLYAYSYRYNVESATFERAATPTTHLLLFLRF